MSALAAALDAVNLAQGIPEPRYDAQWRDAVAGELPDAHFQYTPTRGIPRIRDAVRALYPDCGTDPVITSGCTESLAVALTGFAVLGCERAVWLDPYYSYYPGLAEMAGLEYHTVPIDMVGGRPRLDTDRLRDSLAPLGPRTVLLLNSPHNPSGLTLERPAWREILGILADTGGYLLLDDAYRDFRYGVPEAPYRDLEATGRCAIAGSVSKSFAASGLRLGWLLAPKLLDQHAERAHMHLSNCAPDLLQRAAAGLMAEIGPRRRQATAADYRAKRDILIAALAETGFRTAVPDGGHFVMAYRPGRECADSTAAAVTLAHEAGVVPLPLDSFFDPSRAARPPWLRFSFAVPAGLVSEAAGRLAAWHRLDDR